MISAFKERKFRKKHVSYLTYKILKIDEEKFEKGSSIVNRPS